MRYGIYDTSRIKLILLLYKYEPYRSDMSPMHTLCNNIGNYYNIYNCINIELTIHIIQYFY
jgi:hypothetical protein